MSAEGPIAVFDSGVGGLTVLHECLVSLPSESFLYLGDTGHFPYGTKSPEELRERAEAITAYLIDSGTKLLVVACNSATAAAGPLIHEMGEAAGIPVVTVIGPEAEIAAAISENGRVGVLATPATVASGAYRDALDAAGRPLTVTEVSAPDLASLIQVDLSFDDELIDAVRGHCAPLKEAGVDTLILGCTHYPLMEKVFADALGQGVKVYSQANLVAESLADYLTRRPEFLGSGTQSKFLTTGDPASVSNKATQFLRRKITFEAV